MMQFQPVSVDPSVKVLVVGYEVSKETGRIQRTLLFPTDSPVARAVITRFLPPRLRRPIWTGKDWVEDSLWRRLACFVRRLFHAV